MIEMGDGEMAQTRQQTWAMVSFFELWPPLSLLDPYLGPGVRKSILLNSGDERLPFRFVFHVPLNIVFAFCLRYKATGVADP